LLKVRAKTEFVTILSEMKSIDWKQAAITVVTVIVALAVYERWIGPMIAKKVG